MIHFDDLIFTGSSKYVNEILLPTVSGRFDTSVNKIEKIGDEMTFLRRSYKLKTEGLWIQPGNYIHHITKLYEEDIGKVKVQQLPTESSLQTEDKSEVVEDPKKATLYRSHWIRHQFIPRTL